MTYYKNLQADFSGREIMFFLFVVPTETLEKEKEKKENFQNWLSAASKNMNVKEDEPNQCASQ